MQWTAEDFAGAAERLDDAVAVLRARAGEGAGALEHFCDLDESLPQVRSWLRELTATLDFRHGVLPVFGLLFAQAWRLAFPAGAAASFPDGAERTETGWRVDRPAVWFGDARIAGDLELNAPLVVLGALTVEGLLDDGDVFHSYLAVAGDVRARALRSAADHLVLGEAAAGASPVLRRPRAVAFPMPPLAAALAAPDGVTDLDLSHERLHDLPDALATLTDLVRLNLEHTPLADLDGIGGVSELQWLSIRCAPVRSLAPLLALPRLAHLDVSYCTDVADWSVLNDLPGIEKVVAHGCRLPDDVRLTLADRLGPGLVGL